MLSLEKAQTILKASLEEARSKGMKPLAVVVYDARGAMRALAAEDGTSLKRAEIACGKAYGAIALGVGSRSLHKMSVDRPHFMAAVSHVIDGALVPGFEATVRCGKHQVQVGSAGSVRTIDVPCGDAVKVQP